MRYVPTALLSAVLCLLPTLASTQSLGEIAAREREKRKNAKPTKVYTERDLRGAGQGAPVNIGTGEVTTGATTTEGQAAQPGQPAGQPGAKKEKTEEEVQAEQQKAWRDQVQKANDEVKRLTDLVARMEADAGDLTGPLYGASRQNLMNRLDEAKKQLAAARQNLENLTEQGRRQGFR
jgi:hypothetical protein